MHDPDCRRRGGFFSRFDQLAFLAATLVSFLVYFFTCAPTVTLEDCGELATAGDYAGVPHPPGYPSWTMCAWVFSRLLSWVTFRSQPNPAWAIAVMSAFWGALAAGLSAMLVSRFSADLLAARRSLRGSATAGANARGDDALAALAGVSSALVFAFSPVMWSQSVIVEVYSFGQFFMALVLLLAYRWTARPGARALCATAFFFGLGLTNYQVLLLALVPLVLAVLLTDVALFRDFALACIPLGLGALVLKVAATPDGTPGFFRLPPLDPESPVGGALDWTSRAVANRMLPAFGYARAAAGTHAMEAALVVSVILFVVAAATLGRLAALRSRGGELAPRLAKLRAPALAALALSALAMFVLVCCVPTAVQLPATRLAALRAQYEAAGRPDPTFGWNGPMLAFAAGLAMLWAFALFTPAGLWYALCASGVLLPLIALLRKGALLGLVHPASGWFLMYVCAAALVLAAAGLLLERGREVVGAILAGAAGVAFYGYMAVAGDELPPLNWGYPRTWEGFKHALTRGQYEQIIPESVFTSKFIRQLATYFIDLRTQFTLALAPWALVPFASWTARWRRRRDGAAMAADLLPLAALAAALIAALALFDRLFAAVSLDGARFDKAIFLLLLLAAAAGLVSIFFTAFKPLLRNAFFGGCGRSERLVSAVAGGGILAALAIAGCMLLNPVAEFAIEEIFAVSEGTIAYRILDFALTGVLAAMWLAYCGWLCKCAVRDVPPPVDPAVPHHAARWHLVTFSCFVMMSFVLIALANPRGDIQDAFIQKVKFIASHGLWGMWIGTGLALALGYLREARDTAPAPARRIAGGRVLAVACVAVALAPLVPIRENYCNFGLADTTSAADQNGHDFGWQFGNYQLRGAEAICEELSPDEEPLPDPFFPPPMSSNAVFYGGTDPGRFVPTYMIYSALVRPDVYLITQNALADATYLDTMRGLYSDQIWMPTSDDNRDAFSRYAEEVRSGARPDNGGLSVSADGRVSVNGALSVMEINAILAEQIFRRNRALHEFYVEESYAMQWMFPYLEPHGLIMKVRHSPGPVSPEARRRDSDFWDWYSRRLLASPKFGRDLPARKSFSKLRGSLAGMYAARGDLSAAERAFHQALSLYVYSPESTMRLVREVYFPQRRWDDAVGVVARLAAIDPNNPNVPLSEVVSLRDSAESVARLSPRLRMGTPLSADETLQLALDSMRCGNRAVLRETIAYALESSASTPNSFLRLGLALAAGGHTHEGSRALAKIGAADWSNPGFATDDQLASAYRIHLSARDAANAGFLLRQYLKRRPDDWEAWIDFAVDAWAQGDAKRVEFARAQALRHGGAKAREMLAAYPFLDKIPSTRATGGATRTNSRQ